MKYLLIWNRVNSVSIFKLSSDNAITISKVLNFCTSVKSAWCYEDDIDNIIEELVLQKIDVNKHYDRVPTQP